MPDTGWVLGATAVSDGGGDEAWANPSNALTDNATNATSSPGTAKDTEYLKVTDFDFSVISTNDTIDGIEVRLQIGDGTGSSRTLNCNIVDEDGANLTTDSSSPTLSSSPANVDLGSPTDTWGKTGSWIAADVNDVDFGVRFKLGSNASFACDVVWIKVHYTLGGPTPDTFVNTNSISSPVVGQDTQIQVAHAYAWGAQGSLLGGTNLTPALLSNSSSIYTHTVSATYDLTPNVYTSSNQEYTASVAATYGLTPALFTGTNQEYTASVSATYAVTAPYFDDSSDTIPTATVSLEPYVLTAGVHAPGSTIYTHSVASAYALTVGLTTSSNNIYTLTVSATYDITPALHTSTNQEYTPTVTATYELTPGIEISSNATPSPLVVSGDAIIAPDAFTLTNTLPTHLVGSIYAVTGPYTTNTSTIFTHSALSVNNLTPSLVSSGGSVPTHSLTVGAVDISPDAYANVNNLATHTLNSVYALVAPQTSSTNNVFEPIVSAVYNLTPSLFTASPSFADPTVAVEGSSVFPSLYESTATLHTPNVGVVLVLSANYVNTSTIHTPQVFFTQQITVPQFANSVVINTHIINGLTPDRVNKVLYFARKLTS